MISLANRPGELDEAAERIHEAHLLDRLAVGLEQARRADELDAALRARGRDVDPGRVEDEAQAARRVLPARARERDDHDRRFLPLELVDGADADPLWNRLPERAHLRVVRRHDEDVLDGER